VSVIKWNIIVQSRFRTTEKEWQQDYLSGLIEKVEHTDGDTELTFRVAK